MPDTLDELLGSAAPAVSPRTPDAEATFAAMVADARVAALRGRRAKVARRVGGAAAVVALMAVGTAAAAAVLPSSPRPAAWNGSPGTDKVFEWTATNAAGESCVERLTGWSLTDAEMAGVEAKLKQPAQLLADDGGAVRREFLKRGWASSSAEDTAAIDAAYAEVANLDFAAGRGALRDDQLTSDYITGPDDELFRDIYWRIVLDGIGGGPHDGKARLEMDAETACEYSE